VVSGPAPRRFFDIETVHHLRLGRPGWLGTCATDQRANASGQYTSQKPLSHLGHDTTRVNNSGVIDPALRSLSGEKSDACTALGRVRDRERTFADVTAGDKVPPIAALVPLSGRQ
jgi:hypothetical protein